LIPLQGFLVDSSKAPLRCSGLYVSAYAGSEFAVYVHVTLCP